ncbi:MAG TPA: FliA/WhiG family RNA polymerase sigma factor [Candidatus Deferrimicrobium sp.]|nr:FliA/WhiG family RNA polymerase sigma factor [Candidatus Deferrimicrobium sp.]
MVTTLKAPPKKRGRKPRQITPTTPEPAAAPKKAKRWEVSERDWAQYHKYKTPEIRQKLLGKYVPLVRNVASRMAMGFPRSVELSDLVNTGVIGLIEAFGNFDPGRGVKFETYAVPRIRGAILDELRALDWVPRSTRAKSREIERAMTNLENELGRPPENRELAKHMKLSENELHLAIDEVSSTGILSLDEIIYREDDNRQVPRIETIIDQSMHSVLAQIERGELRSFLVVAIDRLTEQEKLVIALYYYEELTLKEIGEVMSISESRVSQIHTRAVMKLRGMVRERFALTG